MQKHRVIITVAAEVFAESYDDLLDTVNNSFEGPVAHLIGPTVTYIEVSKGGKP